LQLMLPRTDLFRFKSSSFSIKSKRSTSTTRTPKSTATLAPVRCDLQSISCAPPRASMDPLATNTGKSGKPTTLSTLTKLTQEQLARHIFLNIKSWNWKVEKPFPIFGGKKSTFFYLIFAFFYTIFHYLFCQVTSRLPLNKNGHLLWDHKKNFILAHNRTQTLKINKIRDRRNSNRDFRAVTPVPYKIMKDKNSPVHP